MKMINILAAVLMTAAGSAYAADFSDLQALKASEIKAADVVIPLSAPEEVSKRYTAVENLPAKAVSQIITLNIKAKDGIQLSAKAVYMASSGSPSCTHVSFSDGSMQHLPNVFDKQIPVEISGETVRLKAEAVLADSCRSQLKGLALQAVHPKIPEQFGRIEVVRTSIDQGNAVQKVVFKKFDSPYIGTFYSSGDGKIRVGPNGAANAEVSLQK